MYKTEQQYYRIRENEQSKILQTEIAIYNTSYSCSYSFMINYSLLLLKVKFKNKQQIHSFFVKFQSSVLCCVNVIDVNSSHHSFVVNSRLTKR